MSWVPTAVSLVVGTVGAGGLAALLRVAHDHAIARRTALRDDDAAGDAHWSSLVEAQTRSLLEPLQQQVDRHAARIGEPRGRGPRGARPPLARAAPHQRALRAHRAAQRPRRTAAAPAPRRPRRLNRSGGPHEHR